MNSAAAKILELLSNVPSVAASHERIAFAREQVEALDRQLTEARAEIERLRKELARRVPPEFVEHRGVLWKRTGDNDFAPDPYCPHCHSAMAGWPSEMDPVVCGKCKFIGPFRGAEARRLWKSLIEEQQRP